MRGVGGFKGINVTTEVTFILSENPQKVNKIGYFKTFLITLSTY